MLRNFFARRALRILPLYWIALLLCAVAALWCGSTVGEMKPLLIYLGFLQNVPYFVRAALNSPPPLPLFHLWSLAVEEQFYLLWPFLVLAMRTPRRVLWMALGVFALSCLCRWMLFAPAALAHAGDLRWSSFLPVRLGGLALGGALAADQADTRSGAVRVPAAGLALGAGCLFLLQGWRAKSFLLSTSLSLQSGISLADLLCGAALALALNHTLWRRFLQLSAITYLGRISYGFYVFHILLEPAFDALGQQITHARTGFTYQGVRLVVAFCLTLAISGASFRWLEQPWLRLGRRFASRRDTAADVR